MNAELRSYPIIRQPTLFRGFSRVLLAGLAVVVSALFGAAVGWAMWQGYNPGFPDWFLALAPITGLAVMLLGLINYDLLVLLSFATIGFVRFEPAPFDALLVALLAIGLLTGRLRWPSSKGETFVKIGLWMFIAFNILSAVGVVPIGHSLRFLLITLYLLALFVFVRMYATEPRAVRFLLIGYTVSAAISAFLVLVAFFGVPIPFSVLQYGVRGIGFFKDPNVYAPFVIVGALWIADQAVRNSVSFPRTASLLVLLAVLGAGTALSMSRAAWINMALTGCLYGLLLIRGTGRTHLPRLVGLALAVVLAAALVFLFLGLGDIVASRTGSHAYDEQRFDTQWRGVLAGLSNPLGVGPGGWPTAHSLYAKTLAEHGVLGLAALALLIGALVVPLAQRALRERTTKAVLPDALLLGLIFGQLINSFVIDSIHWRHFWVVLGLAWAALQRFGSGKP
jgi:hypothetical protein